jgi:thioredoxin reductase (NADPH)
VSDRYDLVIGGGAAGFTAGIYAARDRCRALLLERFSPGGQVLNNQETYGFPDHDQIFARLDALREQVR